MPSTPVSELHWQQSGSVPQAEAEAERQSSNLGGRKGLGSGERAEYKGCSRDQAGFGWYGHLPMGKAEVALVEFNGRNI